MCWLLGRKLQYSIADEQVLVVGRHDIKQTKEEKQYYER